jgi:hypothetical protein
MMKENLEFNEMILEKDLSIIRTQKYGFMITLGEEDSVEEEFEEEEKGSILKNKMRE